MDLNKKAGVWFQRVGSFERVSGDVQNKKGLGGDIFKNVEGMLDFKDISVKKY